MGIWDAASDFFSGGGKSDINDAYKKAQGFLQPYQEGGAADYANYRNYAKQFGDRLSPWNNAGSYQYNQINQSPVDYYNTIMKGYAESPQAKYEQEQSMRAATAGGSASGMIGSGAWEKGLQQNAADISSRDQQRYYGNVMGANNMQMGYLGDLHNQQGQYNQMQQYLTSLGYGGASAMGENSINQGIANAKMDQSAFDSIAGLVGMGGQNYKNNWAANQDSGGGAQIPWYMMFS